MAAQHTLQQTIEDIKNIVNESIKTFASLQKDYEDIVIKKFKELFHSVQSQISISEHSHDDERNVEAAIENQHSTPGAQCNSSSPNNLPSKKEAEDKKVVSEEPIEETTGQAAHNGEATNISNKKENMTDEQSNWLYLCPPHFPVRILPPLVSNTNDGKEKSIEKDGHPERCLSGKAKENGIKNSKDISLSKLEMFKQSIESFNTKLKSYKEHLEEIFRAFEKRNKDLLKRSPLPTISKLDPSDVQETNAQGDSESSSSCCSCWSHRTTLVTQLYCPNPPQLVKAVTEGLPSVLKKHMRKHHIKLKIKICKSAKDITKDVPLILICLLSSRLGTDVSNAIKGIQTGPNVAVLILHHADSHALPSQSSRKVLTDPEYKQIGTIIDLGFLSPKGLYHCDMNQESLANLALFIKQMSGKQ